MPQTLTPEWEVRLGADASRVYADWLHTLGNLTLTGYNPELSNKPYADKRSVYALSHFDLNRYFGTCETWGPAEIRDRAAKLFGTALQLWPRPPVTASPAPVAENAAQAGFNAECVRLVQGQLGVNLSKLSQTRYQSGDGGVRVVCAVSALHKESEDTPFYWFGFRVTQREFLQQATRPWICLGCGSPETTLLIPLSAMDELLKAMSVTNPGDPYHWHIVVQKRGERLVVRLLGGTDGPDLADFNIGKRPI